MEPDLRWCAYCGRRLDDGVDEDVRLCLDCEADADASMAALDEIMTRGRPEFRGAIALCAPLPGWPTAITLLALEVWDGFSELSYVEIPGPKPSGPQPPGPVVRTRLGGRPPGKWVVTTDLDTVHRRVAGGGGTPGTDKLLAWHATIAPALPDGVRLLHVSALSPGATAEATIDLSTRPMTRRSGVVDHADTPDDADPVCVSCGPPAPAPPQQADQPPGIELDWAMPAPPPRSPDACLVPDSRPLCATCQMNAQAVFAAKAPTRAQPDRVIALGAQLGVFGTDLVIPSVVVWPGWFDVRIAGPSRGSWAEVLRPPVRAGRWAARDDKGHLYRGAATGGSSSVGMVHKDLTFIPGLAADATTLTIDFPSAIDGQGRTATVDLHPEPASTSH